MIPVEPAPEPRHFDSLVRQPGLRTIAELVGESSGENRPGRKRKIVSKNREELKAEHYPPLWREVSTDLLKAYHRICAYACLYIEPVTGSATVDHFACKSRHWSKVYEWDNYRLACSMMNTRKSQFDDVIDPFEVVDGMFALDLVTLKVIPGPNAGANREDVIGTIKRLGLDSAEYADALSEYYHQYIEGHIDFDFLRRRAPFLAREMSRQGRLRS